MSKISIVPYYKNKITGITFRGNSYTLVNGAWEIDEEYAALVTFNELEKDYDDYEGYEEFIEIMEH